MLLSPFLSWDNEQKAIYSLNAINEFLNCPIKKDHGYHMRIWSQLSKSDSEAKWGFKKPTHVNIDHLLIAPFDETEGHPEGWIVRNYP